MVKAKSKLCAIAIGTALLVLGGCDRFRSTEERIARVEQRLATGDQFGAIVDLKSILNSDPKSIHARLLLADLSLRAGDAKGARKEISQARAAGASVQQTARLAADVMLELHEFDQLLQELDGKLPLPVVDQQIYRGLALLGQRQFDQASNALHAALAADQSSVKAQVALARVYAAQGHTDAAMTQLDTALKLNPKDANALLLSSRLSMQRGDLRIAERTLAAALRHASGLLPEQILGLLGSLADVQISLGKLSEARGTQADLTKRAPDSSVAKILAARIAMAERNYPVAIAEAQKVLLATPDLPQVKLLLGAALLANGNLNQAEAVVAELLRAMPDNVGARRLYAKIDLQLKPGVPANERMVLAQGALREGDRQTAITELENICSGDARAIDARLMLASLYLADNRRTDAQKLFQQVTEVVENKAAANLAVGRVYLDAGYPTDALDRFTVAVRDPAANAESWLHVTKANMALGNNVSARAAAQKAFAIQPTSLSVAAALITLDLREGKIVQARARIAELKERHPGDPNVAMQEGDVDMAGKSFADAAAAYEAAYKILPSGAAALRSYGARRMAQMQDRTALLEDWLAREPADISSRIALAEALSDSGATDRAIGHYELLTKQQKPNAMVLNNLAWLYLQAKDGRAEATAKSAYELVPGDARIADTYGWILVKQGKADAGLRILQQAAATANAPDAVRYHYAAALAHSGQQEQARQALQRLVSANGPDSGEVRRLLDELGS